MFGLYYPRITGNFGMFGLIFGGAIMVFVGVQLYLQTFTIPASSAYYPVLSNIQNIGVDSILAGSAIIVLGISGILILRIKEVNVGKK